MKFVQRLSLFLLVTSLLFSCKSKETKTTATEPGKVATAVGTSYNVDVNQSKLLWIGKKVTGQHNGDVKISKGNLTFDGNTLKSGNFTIDMNTINALDVSGGEKASLDGHLKGLEEDETDHFFNVKKYPTATFELTKATKLMNNPEGNYVINGNLTIKGITKQISFKANVENMGNSVKVTTPEFAVNRTDYGIRYGSAKFFDNLKNKAINDDMYFSVNMIANK